MSPGEAEHIGGYYENQLRAGFACRDITPAESLPMGGYIERIGPATGMHDPLLAKAAAFQFAGASAVLLSLDVLYVSHKWTHRLRSAITSKTGVPPANILVAGTHTHSGPAVFSPMSAGNDNAAVYEASLLSACIDAAYEALSTTQPARLTAGASLVEDVAGNRRDPAASGSAPLSVIRVENMHGKALGFIASFACHPTVMGPANLEYSADLFGATAAEIKRHCDGAACLMFSSTGGDMSTRFVRREQTWEEMERLGKELANCIAAASRASQSIKANGIFGTSEVIEFPFCEIPDPETAQAEYNRVLEKAKAASDDWPRDRLARSLVEGAAAKLLLSRMGGWQPIFGTTSALIDVQAIRIGDIIICGLPGEFFAIRESELRSAALPGFGFLIGYANGYWGYLVPPEEAAKGGYETMMSPIDPKNEREIIGAAKRLIRAIGQEAPETTGNA